MTKFLMLPPIDSMRTSFVERLAGDVPGLEVEIVRNVEDIGSKISDAEGAYGWVPPEALPYANKLRWLQNPDAGPFYGYYYQELIDHPVTICNPRGIYSDHIAHHILMFILALSRGLPYWIEAQSKREWNKNARKHAHIDIANSTVLINGWGGIGSETGRLCTALGADVIGIDPQHRESDEGSIYQPSRLNELLPTADFVVTTVPHTPNTENMWNLERFRLMKNSAYFINVGRGKTAKLDDIVIAIKEKSIAGAGLDVFEQEPLPHDHELWSLPNVLITPHVAVAGATNIPERRYQLLRENAERFLRGDQLKNVVDKENWY